MAVEWAQLRKSLKLSQLVLTIVTKHADVARAHAASLRATIGRLETVMAKSTLAALERAVASSR